ncbi:pseudouridine synthase [Patescibacteria group bacterium]
MRLQRFLSLAGVASRRKGEELITAGKVSVNGKTITKLGTKVDPAKDSVVFEKKKISLPDEYIYIALNKPIGYTTSLADEHADKIVSDLLPKDLPRLVPVGRLDKESEGLLIMTNDGEFINELTHPSFKHEKEYEVTVEGRLKNSQREEMRTGMLVEGEAFMGVEIEKISQDRQQGLTTYRLVLKEGKKRQIRRMFGTYGVAIVKLMRTRIQSLKLGDLAPGGYRQITKNDILKSN